MPVLRQRRLGDTRSIGPGGAATALLAAAAALLAAAPAAAGHGERGDWELGPYVGFGLLDDYDGVRPEDHLLLGVRAGCFLHPLWSIEGSYQSLSTEARLPAGSGLRDVDLVAARLNVLLNFRPGRPLRPFVTTGIGSERIDVAGAGSRSDTGFNAGGGLRWFLTDRFGVRVDGRYVTVDAGGLDARQNNIEGTAGVLWAFGGGPAPDADRDGAPDRKDACPDTPRGAAVDAAGCPRDADGDGVYDGIDTCPGTSKGWPVDAAGCPKDTDGDGVADGADACPDTPRGATVDARGCPADSDGDGTYDGLDRCPDTPEGARVEAAGCPIDSDGDGAYDGLDACPDTPEGIKVDAQGCPLPLHRVEPLFDEVKRTLVLQGVNFETDSDVLTPDSTAVLDRVAASLNDWPAARVEIGGHTDSTGGDAHNQALSLRRAESVRSYLAAKGVDASRLTARGYGAMQPIDSDETRRGRARNRRVELKRLD